MALFHVPAPILLINNWMRAEGTISLEEGEQLCAGFNPCTQCKTTRGRLSDDLFIFAHPGVNSGKRVGNVSLRKVGKLRHPCELGPDML